MKKHCWMGSFWCCALASLQVAFAQGVAVPNRPNRPQPKVKVNIPLPKVQFLDVAAKAGLTAPNVSGPERDKQYIIETTGSGVALFDYDNDGWLDIFMVNGTTLAPPPKGLEPTSHLYRNNHDGTFADITQKAGVADSVGWKTGVTMADVNGDGKIDMYVSGVDYLDMHGRNVLYINNGDGSFTDRTREAGLEHAGYSTQALFFDYDGDGDLDVYLLDHSTHREREAGRGKREA